MTIESAAQTLIKALTSAIKNNDAPLVRSILTDNSWLQAEIDKPLPNYSFDAPAIFAAVQKENREMIDAILDAGANINQRTLWWAGGFGVLDSASPPLAEYLISRGAVVDIHAAARLGKLDRVKELLTADPLLVHARGGDGQLPLHFASTVEIAAFLLERGADMDARDIDHESTAAQYMASIAEKLSYRHDVARFLIARGARTDILMASAVGDLGLVERILNQDPEAIRITASERSFPKRNPHSGGSIYIYGFGNYKSPHLIARQFGHTAVFDLLMERSAPWLRLVQAAELGDKGMIEEIRNQHPSPIAGLSPVDARRIVEAAFRNQSGAVEVLLRCGWPPNAMLENSQTALHFAAWHGNAAMVQGLLARNARTDIFETEYGGNALAWALHGSLNSWERGNGDYATATRALLNAGAPIPETGRALVATKEVLEVVEQYRIENAG